MRRTYLGAAATRELKRAHIARRLEAKITEWRDEAERAKKRKVKK